MADSSPKPKPFWLRALMAAPVFVIWTVLMINSGPRLGLGDIPRFALIALVIAAPFYLARWIWRRVLPEPVKERFLQSWQLAIGAAYFVFVAFAVHGLTGRHFLFSLLVVIGAAVVWVAITLAWMIRWAKNPESRGGQFSLGSLLIATLMISMFLAMTQWLAVAIVAKMSLAERQQVNWAQVFAGSSVVTFCLGLLGIPILMQTTTRLIWIAAWAIRRPNVRRMLRLPGSE